MKKIFKVIRVIIAVILIAIGLITIFGEEPEVDLSTVEFEKVNYDTLYERCESNPAAAKSDYKDKYFEITGRLYNIDSDLSYITICRESNIMTQDIEAGNYEGTWDAFTLLARIKNDAVKEDVKTLNIGDMVTIKIKITDVGEVLGYTADLYEIVK